MSNLAFALFTLLVATSGCSESSSAKPTPAAPPSTTAPVAAAPQAAPAGAAPQAAAVDCDQACTDYAICVEAYYEGESFRDGEGCVDVCNAMAPQARAAYAAELAAAVRKKQCAAYMRKREGGSEEAAAAPAPVVPLSAEQEPELGCFAWTPISEVVACSVGETGSSGSHVDVVFVGSEQPPMALVDDPNPFASADAAAVAKVNDVLATQVYRPLPGTAKRAKPRGSVTVNGVALSIKRVQTDDGGPNMPPSADYWVYAACKGRKVELFEDGGEGVDVTASLRAVGAEVLVEIAAGQHREGESRETMRVMFVDPVTCAISRRGSATER